MKTGRAELHYFCGIKAVIVHRLESIIKLQEKNSECFKYFGVWISINTFSIGDKDSETEKVNFPNL